MNSIFSGEMLYVKGVRTVTRNEKHKLRISIIIEILLGIGLLTGFILFKQDIMSEAGLMCWLLGVVLFTSLMRQIWRMVIKVKSRLEFTKDYMIFRLPRYLRYGADNKERREKYFVIRYADIKNGSYNKEEKYIDISGKITSSYYELDENGRRKNNGRHTRYIDGTLRFYIYEDKEEKTIQLIEEYCGIKFE